MMRLGRRATKHASRGDRGSRAAGNDARAVEQTATR